MMEATEAVKVKIESLTMALKDAMAIQKAHIESRVLNLKTKYNLSPAIESKLAKRIDATPLPFDWDGDLGDLDEYLEEVLHLVISDHTITTVTSVTPCNLFSPSFVAPSPHPKKAEIPRPKQPQVCPPAKGRFITKKNGA